MRTLKLGFIYLITYLYCSIGEAKNIDIELPFLINNVFKGDITVNLPISNSNDNNVRISTKRLTVLLSDISSDKQLKQWLNNYNDVSTVSLKQLQDNGLRIKYSPELLNISAKIVKDGISAISVSQRKAQNKSPSQVDAFFSSGLNLSINNSYNHNQRNKGRQPLQTNITGFSTVGGFNGWSLLYDLDYLEDAEKSFARGDVSILHNDFKRAIRYSLGDIRPTVSRFQSSISLAGLSIERDYSGINPFRNLQSSGRQTFTLKRESIVSFIVNGQTVLTETLVEGSYSVADFPVSSGINDISIIVDDGISIEEISSLSTYVNTNLLDVGINKFGINIGYPVIQGSPREQRKYQDEPVAFAFWEKGVRNNLTVGSQLEISKDHQLLAGSLIFAAGQGIWALESAISKQKDNDTGHSGIVRYEWNPTTRKNAWSTRFDMQYSYQSGDFANLTQKASIFSTHDFSSRYSIRKNKISFSLGANLRKSNKDIKNISATISKSFKKFSLSSNLKFIDDSDKGQDTQWSINFTKRLGTYTARTGYASKNNQYTTEVRNTTYKHVNDFSQRFALTDSDKTNITELNAGYVGSRYEIDARYRRNKNKENSTIISSRSNVRLSSGIGLADGEIAFGRPFSHSFIILNRHKSLKGKAVSINRSNSNNRKITGTQWLDNTLIPLNSSYQNQRFSIEVEDLPVGYDLGSGEINLFPRRYGGYIVDVGSNAANTVMGNLLDNEGKPITLSSGELISTSIEQPKIIIFFTNRTGRFIAEKVPEGLYTINLSNDDDLTGTLNIKPGKEPGLIKVGDIKLEKKQ